MIFSKLKVTPIIFIGWYSPDHKQTLFDLYSHREKLQKNPLNEQNPLTVIFIINTFKYKYKSTN